jgi:hypothetical protein
MLDPKLAAALAEAETRSPSGPTPFSVGSYALYRTPKGGIHLVYRPKGAEEDTHIDIPPMIVKMAEKAATGPNGGSAVGKMMGMGQ